MLSTIQVGGNLNALEFFYARFRHTAKELLWLVRGISIKSPPIPSQVKTITFLCHGNIIRSVFAEKIARQLAQDLRIPPITFRSAGINAKPGSRSPESAITVAREHNIDLTSHRSTLLTEELVEQSDMIVCMEERHGRAVRRRYSSASGKVFLLPLLAEEDEGRDSYSKLNIPDPYGKSEAALRDAFQRIAKCTEALLRKISAQ